MMEATFPLMGAAFALLVVLPSTALFAKLTLRAMSHFASGDGMHGLGLRYALLFGATWMPLAWLLSAGAHQAETGRSAVACLLDHGQTDDCGEAALFTALLAISAIGLGFRRSRKAARSVQTMAAHELGERIEGLVASSPALSGLRGRVLAVDKSDLAPVATVGWLRPRVIVETAFAEQLDDAALASTLAHELEHVRGLDPLRYALLSLALRICPFGRLLLGREAAQWVLAREAHCDREAVRQGADAAALAQALVCAARPSTSSAVSALGAGNVASLRLRVGLLLSYTRHSPACACHRSNMGLRIALCGLLIAVVLPHVSGTHALDVIHSGAESVLHQLGW